MRSSTSLTAKANRRRRLHQYGRAIELTVLGGAELWRCQSNIEQKSSDSSGACSVKKEFTCAAL